MREKTAHGSIDTILDSSATGRSLHAGGPSGPPVKLLYAHARLRHHTPPNKGVRA
ncbi:MAG: hypothetical protein HZA69_05400 [Gammaproteobacteria bacterium]|nr:hypothetical protein [Gammaproteobacteria bacterium]